MAAFDRWLESASTRAQIDLVFNLLLGFVFLFVIAFVMITPNKRENIEVKAEYQVVVTWEDGSTDDVDTWVEAPGGQIVSFRNAETGLMHLDRDDLGESSDTVRTVGGERVVLRLNREVVAIRGIVPGWYTVNVHMYRKLDTEPTRVHVEVEKVNPYNLVYRKRMVLNHTGEERTVVRFRVKDDGTVDGLDFRSKPLFTGTATARR